jgi:pilus assembly protein FimV
LIDKSHCWKKTAMAAATAVFCLWSSNAAALSLGRITVQSALGEPLRAEVEIPEINADEAASLQASIALPDAFRAAGLDYNPAMASVQVTLQRRNDGRAYIRISGDKAINDPFVDMILEARWASGRIVRDYTLLFDPPRARQAAQGVPTPAQIATPPLPQRPATPAPVAAAPPAKPVPTSAPTELRKASPVQTEEKPVNGTRTVSVTRGDTAGKIAASVKPASVSLDQMLVAMLRSNPNAFIGDNINRIKAGTVIDIPTEEQASTTTAGEASRIIIAQSRDFNDFRRKLASGAPEIPVVAATRQVTGAVQAKVEEKKPVATTPDKLTLTKGAVQGKTTEELIAAERSAKEAASRAVEIARNIRELGQLNATPNAAAPMAAASQAAAIPPVPEAKAAAASEPATPVSAPVVATAAPKPAASAPKPASSAEPSEPNMLDGLIEDPLVPAGAISLIALLAGLGVYRIRQRKNATQVDSAFQESRSRPDSFFGASGGQSVNTNDSSATGSSMMYSPSQLDAVDDVDPVAEADVYLAYGRDIQAEEILKDALLTNSARLAIHHKLLEIYAKRRDTQAFESIARQAYKACNGDHSEWERICELGLSIDPGNALYQPGGEPGNADGGPSRQAAMDGNSPSLQGNALAAMAPAAAAGAAVDLDLDLDFSIDDEPGSDISNTATSNATPSIVEPESESGELDLDFGMKTQVFERPAIAPSDANSNAMEFTLPDLDINEPSLDTEAFRQQAAASFGTTGPAPLPEPKPPEQDDSPSDMGMLEFDLESLSLDLGDSGGPITLAERETDTHEDPLVTKLALAEEFRAIGDDDGARALIDEVISEATGDMKIKAQRALSNL